MPVVLRRVVLVQPQFDGATFQGAVTMQGCLLEKPGFGKPTEFAQDFGSYRSPLRFDDGMVSLGPIKLGSTPALF